MFGVKPSSSIGTRMAHNGATGSVLSVLGWLLLSTLVAWILATTLGVTGHPPPPRLFSVGTQHATEFNFSSMAQQRLEDAQIHMDKANRSYNIFRWLSDLATWASFFATAAITLITGGFSLPLPKPGEQDRTKVDPAEVGRSPRPGRFYALGFLAAVASVCTLLGAQLGTKASTTLACAKETRDRITEVAQALKDTPESEIALLIKLRDATGRSCV